MVQAEEVPVQKPLIEPGAAELPAWPVLYRAVAEPAVARVVVHVQPRCEVVKVDHRLLVGRRKEEVAVY